MTLWMWHINQWSAGRRFSLLLVTLFILVGIYFFLEKPVFQANIAITERQMRAKETLEQINALAQQQQSFVYADSLRPVQLRLLLQKPLTSTLDLEMTDFKDQPAVVLPMGADQFAQAKKALNLSLLKSIKKYSAVVTFSGSFDAFVAYLKILQSNDNAIAYESLSFDMRRYPTAVVTMKVFTLGE